MADFRTAEQYVVARVETLEAELEAKKIAHALEVAELKKKYELAMRDLEQAYTILDSFRDYVSVNKDDYFGNCIYTDTIYGNEDADAVRRIVEYFDLRHMEENDDA